MPPSAADDATPSKNKTGAMLHEPGPYRPEASTMPTSSAQRLSRRPVAGDHVVWFEVEPVEFESGNRHNAEPNDHMGPARGEYILEPEEPGRSCDPETCDHIEPLLPVMGPDHRQERQQDHDPSAEPGIQGGPGLLTEAEEPWGEKQDSAERGIGDVDGHVGAVVDHDPRPPLPSRI